MRKGTTTLVSMLVLVLLAILATSRGGTIFSLVQPPDEVIYSQPSNTYNDCPYLNKYCDPAKYQYCVLSYKNRDTSTLTTKTINAGMYTGHVASSANFYFCEVTGKPIQVEVDDTPTQSLSVNDIPSFTTEDTVIITVTASNIADGELVYGYLGEDSRIGSVINGQVIFDYSPQKDGVYNFYAKYGTIISPTKSFTVLASFTNFRIDAFPSQKITEPVLATIHLEDKYGNPVETTTASINVQSKYTDGTLVPNKLSWNGAGDWGVSVTTSKVGTLVITATATKSGYKSQTITKEIVVGTQLVGIEFPNMPMTSKTGDNIEVSFRLFDASTDRSLDASYIKLTITDPKNQVVSTKSTSDFTKMGSLYILNGGFTFPTTTTGIETYKFSVVAEATNYGRNNAYKTVNVIPDDPDIKCTSDANCPNNYKCEAGVCIKQSNLVTDYGIYIGVAVGIIVLVVMLGGKKR